MKNFSTLVKKIVDKNDKVTNSIIKIKDGDSILELFFKDGNTAHLNLTSIFNKFSKESLEDQAEALITDIFAAVEDEPDLDSFYVELRPQNPSVIRNYEENFDEKVSSIPFTIPLVWSLATDSMAAPVFLSTYERYGFNDKKSFMSAITTKYERELSDYKIVVANTKLIIKLEDFEIEATLTHSPQNRLTEMMSGPLFYKVAEKTLSATSNDTINLLPVNRNMVIMCKNARLSLDQHERMMLLLFLKEAMNHGSFADDDVFIGQSILAEIVITDNGIELANRLSKLKDLNIEFMDTSMEIKIDLQSTEDMKFGIGSVRTI